MWIVFVCMYVCMWGVDIWGRRCNPPSIVRLFFFSSAGLRCMHLGKLPLQPPHRFFHFLFRFRSPPHTPNHRLLFHQLFYVRCLTIFLKRVKERETNEFSKYLKRIKIFKENVFTNNNKKKNWICIFIFNIYLLTWIKENIWRF